VSETAEQTLRVRAARLGWLTALAATFAVLLLVAGAVLLARATPSGWEPTLPLGLADTFPGARVLLASAFGLTGLFLGVAALQTSAAMRTLSRTRRRPERLAGPARGVRRLLLGPGVEYLELDHLPDWPRDALPSAAELAAVQRVRVTVLVPAHDEEAVLGLTLESLAGQRRPPDRIVVIADNCSDRTVEVARAHGAEVRETVRNTEKKAGALNQQLAELLPTATASDVVLVMDADSTIAPDYLAIALGLLEDDPDLMAVSGLFYGEEGGGLIGQFQRNEYSRYQRVVSRRPERVFVLTGTASVIRSYALRAVAAARGPLIPGPPGQVYDTLAMTEDNELTLALKTLGAKMIAPPQCVVTTEVMTTWPHLWRQRLRWHRGAVENIGVYGLTRATALYWRQQAGLAYGVVAFMSYLLLFFVTILAADSLRWSTFWVVVGIVFVLERLATVWRAGWRARGLALPMVPELAFAFFLQVCFLASLVQAAGGTKADWNYVPRPAVQGVVASLGLALHQPSVGPYGILLPASVLETSGYEALATWVAFNTLVFVGLSLVTLAPPLPRPETRAARAAILRVVAGLSDG
jgi:cellulose synthase/poly-beta-1,6-N-acetylglucosamine synthase-like glycosyltransferase